MQNPLRSNHRTFRRFRDRATLCISEIEARQRQGLVFAILPQIHWATLDDFPHSLLDAPVLQRRLRDQGVLFNDVLDTTRFRAAKSYLTHRDIAGTEVAYLLGFAEQSSFDRAFKRWSGQTPTEYRFRTAAI